MMHIEEILHCPHVRFHIILRSITFPMIARDQLLIFVNTDDAPREEQQTAAGESSVVNLCLTFPMLKLSCSDSMEPDNGLSQTKKISTHGSRNSRREQWRASKGLNPRPKSRGMNRQGGAAAKQRAGRPHRRR